MKATTFFLGLVLSYFFLFAQLRITGQPMTNLDQKSFIFMDLPYGFDALEPYIDQMTMEIHFERHHKGYYSNFMKAIEGSEWSIISLTEMFSVISELPVSIRNNGGGYYNHELFWENLAPSGTGGEPSDELMSSIIESFGSFDNFKNRFSQEAATRFGSGWAWLISDDEGTLSVTSTPNQDNPLMNVAEKQGIPLLCLDVWEHAYYLKYQNKRGDYIDGFWNIVNWHVVNDRYKQVIGK